MLIQVNMENLDVIKFVFDFKEDGREEFKFYASDLIPREKDLPVNESNLSCCAKLSRYT